ncbi:MAG: ABC transporter substrate-binding protein [Armatimonadetes bacterium]|nr:ABC transporter substrate-binding protein [Armatimonadota bacterium]
MHTGRYLILVLVAVLLVLGGSAASAPARQELVIGNEADVTWFDPIRIQEAPTSLVAGMVYEQLVQRNHEGKVVPSLAEGWKISPDRRTWTFSLRKGVKFHDGSDFDASIVEWAYRRVLDPREASGFRAQFSVIEKITVPDRYTIAFTLKEPNAAFLEYVLTTNAAYLPSKKAYETLGKEFSFKPIGTGAWRWVQWIQGQRVILERNPNYWGAAPKMERLVFRPILDPNTGVIELETGGVHYIMRASREDIIRLGKDPRFAVHRVPTYRIRFISMNSSRPVFADLKVRQALNHALDMPQIVDALAGGMAVSVDTVLPVQSPFHPAKGTYTTYPYDLQKARALLSEAGWKPGTGGVLTRDGQALRFVLHSPNGRYFADKEISEVICNRLRRVGAECRVKVMEWASFLEEVRSGRYDAAFLGWNQSSGEPSLFLDAMAKTRGRANYAKQSDPAIDAALDEGLIAFSEGRRKMLYAKAVDLVNKNAWYVPINNEFKIAITSSRVQGYIHSAPRTDFLPVWLK